MLHHQLGGRVRAEAAMLGAHIQALYAQLGQACPDGGVHARVAADDGAALLERVAGLDEAPQAVGQHALLFAVTEVHIRLSLKVPGWPWK